MWPIKTCIFFIGFIGACALSFVYPIVGVVNYMIVYQINPNKMWWGIPLEPLGVRYAMTAAMCLIVGMVVSARRVPASRLVLGDWLLLLLVFTAIVLISGEFGMGQSDYSITLIDKMLKMTIFLICFVKMGATRANFKIMLWALVVGTLLLGWDAFNAPKGDFHDGRLNFVGGVDFRESSGLAAHMAAMLPLVGAMALATPSWRKKLVTLAAGVLAVNTIIQCRTRSAFVGMLACAAVAVIAAPRSRRMRVYMSLLIAAIGAHALTDFHFWDRMNTVVQPKEFASDATIQARLELWSVAGQMFLDYPLGVGVGRFREKLAEYDTGNYEHAFNLPKRVTHNTYLLCITELGVQGSVVFLTIILSSLHKLRRCKILSDLSDNPIETRMLVFGCLLSIVAYLGAAAFTDRLYTESLWWVLALPVCLEQAVMREVVARNEMPVLAIRRSIVDVEGDSPILPDYGVAPGSLG